jgi:hypothetical protein
VGASALLVDMLISVVGLISVRLYPIPTVTYISDDRIGYTPEYLPTPYPNRIATSRRANHLSNHSESQAVRHLAAFIMSLELVSSFSGCCIACVIRHMYNGSLYSFDSTLPPADSIEYLNIAFLSQQYETRLPL